MPHTQDHRLEIPALIARLPIFQELTTGQVEQIASQVREKRLTKGEMLFQKGDQPRGFYIIVYGQLKLAFPASNGNEKVVDILGPKQSFGESVMFIERTYPVFAEALSDSLLLHVAKDAVFDLLDHDPSFARRMLAGLSMRLHSLMQDVESYSLRSSAQRVIGYLLQHCPNEVGQNCEGRAEITLPTSKQIIASRLNLTPETLSRIFHDLADAKLIDVAGKQIIVHSLKRLREYDL